MGSFLDDVYDILFKPSRGMEKVSREKNIWQGFLVYLVVSVIVTLSNTASQAGQMIEEFRGFPVSPELMEGMARFMPFLNLPLIPLYFFLFTAVLHLTVELLGGEGRISRLGAVLGYGHIPYIFMLPVSLAARYFPFNPTGFFSLAISIWALVLKVNGIRNVYNISLGRALVSYFLPFIFLFGLLVLFLLLAGILLGPFLAELM